MGTLDEVLGRDEDYGAMQCQANAWGMKQRRLAWERQRLERRLAKLRVKGPSNGRLYVCYDWRKPGRCATALTPEGALNAWRSYWSLIP
jgi:hypothetical protein